MRLNLDSIGDRLRSRLAEKHAARERALPLSREAIRFSANSIRATHRGEIEKARSILDQARSHVAQIREALAEYPDIYYAGFAQDAEKEFVEASILLAIVSGMPIPEPEELDVSPAVYLNGLGEAASELRRYVLDQLRHRSAVDCEPILEAMDEVYSLLVTMDFPDSLTGGLRRTTDLVRGVLERTRGDLTLAVRQASLEQQISAFQSALSSAQRL